MKASYIFDTFEEKITLDMITKVENNFQGKMKKTILDRPCIQEQSDFNVIFLPKLSIIRH